MVDPTPPAPGSCSEPRWCGWVASIFVFHVVLVFVLSSRPPPSATGTLGPSRVRLVTQPVVTTSLTSQLWLDDPAELALASADGFSGPVWRQLPRLDPGLLPHVDRPQWLTQDASRLGAAPAPSPARPIPCPSSAPPLPSPHSDIAAPAVPTTTPSMAHIEGDLAGRRRLDAPPLPSWPHHDVLAPTTVQLMVDQDGSVLSATLLTRSGLPAADQKALDLARAARFAPAAAESTASPLTWGQLVFQWQVLPPGTNTP